MDGTCQNCRWWADRLPLDPAGPSHRWKVCGLATFGYPSTKPTNPHMEAWCPTGNDGTLFTAPEFGCVQFEARHQQPARDDAPPVGPGD